MFRQTTKGLSEKHIIAFQCFIFIPYLMRKNTLRGNSSEKMLQINGYLMGLEKKTEVVTTL